MRRVLMITVLALMIVSVPVVALAYPNRPIDPIRPTSVTIFSVR